jgi:hypothetical protein
MQFVVTLSESAKARFPGKILETCLKLPQPVAKKPAKRVSKVASGTVVLIHLDGRLQVNFNQTLDLRLVDKKMAQLLNRIAYSNVGFTRRVIHFSLNDIKDLDRIRRCYSHFDFTAADNVEFICMYGFNTTLAEDVERFRFLRSLPGAYVFVQEYQPIPGGPVPDLKNFFDDSADRLIDELVGILFP